MASTGSFGRHVIADIWDAPFHELDDLLHITDTLVEASEICGATVLNVKPTKFDPQGCSVTITLSESHVAIHTFPELGYASFDAYTCGELADPMVIMQYLINDIGGEAHYELKHRGLSSGMKIAETGIYIKNRYDSGESE